MGKESGRRSLSHGMSRTLDFSRCRDVWVPDDSDAGGFWSPPPPHVRYGVEQIIAQPWFLLADDMGGMKTAQGIIAAQFLHDAGVIDRVIVVAPASVRPKVWYDEDLGQLREQVFDDKRNMVTEYHARRRSWTHGPDDAKELRWIVTNYEYIRSRKNLAVLLPYCTPKTLLILDESNAVRTWDSAQTDACMTLRWLTNKKGRPVHGMPRCGRVLLLNGTPVAESPMDMFAQGNLMHPSILECRYVTHYKARYAVQVPVLGAGGKPVDNGYGKSVLHVESWTNLDDLTRRFAPYVLRREAKELGIDFALPPVALEVRLTEQTWKHYKAMRDEMVVMLKNGIVSASQAGVQSIRLAQITSGFVGGVESIAGEERIWDLSDDGCVSPASTPTLLPVTADGHVNAMASSNVFEVGREKLDFAIEWQRGLLERYPNMKLLAWMRFVPELRRYMAEVKKFGHPVGAASGASIFGDSVKHEREFALKLLHPKTAPEGPATVGATQGTGALGLNFTACRTVLDISYDFSPWKKQQGDARVNRPGQTGMVSFFYLVAVGPKGQKTIDHHILLHRMGKTNVNEYTTAGWVKALMEE